MQNDHGLNAMSAVELAAVRDEKRCAQRRRAAARRRAEDLQRRLARVEELKPGSGPRFAAGVFSLLTHSATLGVVAGSVLLLLSGNVVGMIVGALGLGVAWVVRPRMPRAARGVEWKSRSDLPEFFALLDRAASVIDAPVPDRVRFGAMYNAGTARRGWRRRPVLTIGLPLWHVLDGPERLALLGHELGHQVNGDATQGMLAGSAAISLAQWRTLFRPQRTATRLVRRIDRNGRTVGTSTEGPSAQEVLQAAVVTLCFAPIYLTVSLLLVLHNWLTVHVSLRAEFAADGLGARVGSTQGALGLTRKLDVAPSVGAFVRRAKSARAAGGIPAKSTPQEGLQLFADLTKYLQSLPDHEYVRQSRIGEFRGTTVDASHPATYLRIRLLEERPAQSAALSVSDEQWAAVDRELAPYSAAIGAVMLR